MLKSFMDTTSVRARVVLVAYERLRRNALTINELNKIHIQLENTMTPHERAVIASALLRYLNHSFAWRVGIRLHKILSLGEVKNRWLLNKKTLIEGSKAWFRRIDKNSATKWQSAPEVWSRRAISPGVLHYSRTDAKNDCLAISFTGKRRRMMVALADYLQALNSSATDVLLVRTSKNKAYRDGIPGFGDSLWGSLERLSSFVRSLGYQRIVLVGASAGGVPAIVTGLHLNAGRIIVLGPGREFPSQLDSLRAGKAPSPTVSANTESRVTVLVGENAPQRDHEAAAFWREKIGAEVQVVPQARHSPMDQLIRAGLFPGLLE